MQLQQEKISVLKIPISTLQVCGVSHALPPSAVLRENKNKSKTL